MKKLRQLEWKTPWFIILSRVCLFSGAALLLLTDLRILFAGDPFYADGQSVIVHLGKSGRVYDRVLLTLFFTLAAAGPVVCFGRKETRRSSVLLYFGVLLAASVTAAICDKSSPRLSAALMDIGLFLPSIVLGLRGALFEKKHGKAASEIWHAKRARSLIPPFAEPTAKVEKKPVKAGDISRCLVLLAFTAAITFAGIQDVKRGAAGIWPFIVAELFALVLVIYFASVTNSMKAPSVWMSRILTGFAAMAALLTILHFIQIRPFERAVKTAAFPELSKSFFWPDHLLFTTVIMFAVTSGLLTLKRPETRRIVLPLFPLWLVLISGGSAALSLLWPGEDHLLYGLLLWLILLSWPLFTGLYAVAFERLYGKEATNQWLSGMAAKQAGKKTPRPVSQPVSRPMPQPPSRPAAVPGQNPPPAVSPQPVKQTTATSQNDREEYLRQKKREYEERRRTKDEEKPLRPASQVLPEVAARLYPTGPTLATLAGQRQLAVLLKQGVPYMRPLHADQTAEELMRPDLKDDPGEFLPVLEKVVKEAAKTLLMKKQAWNDDDTWLAQPCDDLAGGWFALRMYARMSREGEVFDSVAESIEAFFDRHPEHLSRLESITNGGEDQHAADLTGI